MGKSGGGNVATFKKQSLLHKSSNNFRFWFGFFLSEVSKFKRSQAINPIS